MSAYASLFDLSAGGAAACEQGHWFNIALAPDLGTGEQLNVGVGYIDAGGRLHTRMLADFQRLECLYADRLDLDHLRFLLQSVPTAWGAPSPSPHLQFGPLRYAAGESVAAILDDLYRDIVTLEPGPASAEAPEPDRPNQLDNASARRLVFDALKLKSPFSTRIIPPNSEWPASDDEAHHILDMPIRGAHRFASLLSAWCRTKTTLELRLIRGALDLQTAARMHPADAKALFILRPADGQRGYTEEQHRQIDTVIDMVEWRLRRSRVHIDVESAPETLAERILAWADLAA